VKTLYIAGNGLLIQKALEPATCSGKHSTCDKNRSEDRKDKWHEEKYRKWY